MYTDLGTCLQIPDVTFDTPQAMQDIMDKFEKNVKLAAEMKAYREEHFPYENVDKISTDEGILQYVFTFGPARQCTSTCTHTMVCGFACVIECHCCVSNPSCSSTDEEQRVRERVWT